MLLLIAKGTEPVMAKPDRDEAGVQDEGGRSRSLASSWPAVVPANSGQSCVKPGRLDAKCLIRKHLAQVP